MNNQPLTINHNNITMVLSNKTTAEYFDPAFGADQPDQKITIPNTYNGMISNITPEAAEVYVKLGGNLIVKKEQPQPVKAKEKPAADK